MSELKGARAVKWSSRDWRSDSEGRERAEEGAEGRTVLGR